MHVEVDQSGRIEETQRDTIIAIANDAYAISLRIRRQDKRIIQSIFKERGKPKMFAICMFGKTVSYLLNQSSQHIQVVTIDIEYPGHEKTIKDIILQDTSKKLDVRFARIGKNSPAHTKAYFTFTKQIQSDFVYQYKNYL